MLKTFFLFANNINTVEGGTHLVGFKTALTRYDQPIRNECPTSQRAQGELDGERHPEGLVGWSSASRFASLSLKGRPRPSSATCEVKRNWWRPIVKEKLGRYFEKAQCPRGKSSPR